MKNPTLSFVLRLFITTTSVMFLLTFTDIARGIFAISFLQQVMISLRPLQTIAMAGPLIIILLYSSLMIILVTKNKLGHLLEETKAMQIGILVLTPVLLSVWVFVILWYVFSFL